MPVTATGASGQLALAPDDETAPTALVQSLFSGDVQIELQHDRLLIVGARVGVGTSSVAWANVLAAEASPLGFLGLRRSY
jgi:hypothetical protein